MAKKKPADQRDQLWADKQTARPPELDRLHEFHARQVARAMVRLDDALEAGDPNVVARAVEEYQDAFDAVHASIPVQDRAMRDAQRQKQSRDAPTARTLRGATKLAAFAQDRGYPKRMTRKRLVSDAAEHFKVSERTIETWLAFAKQNDLLQ